MASRSLYVSKTFLLSAWICARSTSRRSAPIDASAILLICSVLFLGKSSFSRAPWVKFDLVPKSRTRRA
jgi:hypothetical protein